MDVVIIIFNSLNGNRIIAQNNNVSLNNNSNNRNVPFNTNGISSNISAACNNNTRKRSRGSIGLNDNNTDLANRYNLRSRNKRRKT